MSFQAKSAAITLFVVAALYAIYFARVLPGGAVSTAEFFPQLVMAAMTLVFVMIVGHVALAIGWRMRESGGEEADERDRLIGQRADARSGYVLAVGLFAVLALVLAGAAPFWVAHAALAALVVSEIAKQALRLIDYARGV